MSPATIRLGMPHHHGTSSKPTASGRSSQNTSVSSCSSARKPKATTDTGMPTSPQMTSNLK